MKLCNLQNWHHQNSINQLQNIMSDNQPSMWEQQESPVSPACSTREAGRFAIVHIENIINGTLTIKLVENSLVKNCCYNCYLHFHSVWADGLLLLMVCIHFNRIHFDNYILSSNPLHSMVRKSYGWFICKMWYQRRMWISINMFISVCYLFCT